MRASRILNGPLSPRTGTPHCAKGRRELLSRGRLARSGRLASTEVSHMTVGVTHTSGSRLVAQSADAARSGPCITGVRRGALLSQGSSKSRTMADSAARHGERRLSWKTGAGAHPRGRRRATFLLQSPVPLANAHSWRPRAIETAGASHMAGVTRRAEWRRMILAPRAAASYSRGRPAYSRRLASRFTRGEHACMRRSSGRKSEPSVLLP